MSFLVQPLKDLTVPLYHLARGNLRDEALKEGEAWIQAALRTTLAVGFALTLVATIHLTLHLSYPAVLAIVGTEAVLGTFSHLYSTVIGTTILSLYVGGRGLAVALQRRNVLDGVLGLGFLATSVALSYFLQRDREELLADCWLDRKIVDFSKFAAPHLARAFGHII